MFQTNFTQKQITAGKKFDDLTNNSVWKTCQNCNISFPDLPIDDNPCHKCQEYPQKFTVTNNMDPGDVPDELQDLTLIEQICITRVRPIISLYRRQGAQYRYKGNIINLSQVINTYRNILPIIPKDFPVILIFEKDTPNGILEIRARA